MSSVLIVSRSPAGFDRAVDVHDILVGEAAHHLRDRVGLADVGEELVAEPLAVARPLDDAGDVDERHRGGQDALAAEHLGELREARVRQADDADVRLDRRERIVRRQHLILGEGVEQGGLADVRESDDGDSESHGGQSYRGTGAAPRVFAAADGGERYLSGRPIPPRHPRAPGKVSLGKPERYRRPRLRGALALGRRMLVGRSAGAPGLHRDRLRNRKLAQRIRLLGRNGEGSRRTCRRHGGLAHPAAARLRRLQRVEHPHPRHRRLGCHRRAELWSEQLPDLVAFADGDILVAHNAGFDMGVISARVRRLRASTCPSFDYLCSLQVARKTYHLDSYQLPVAAMAAGFEDFQHHQALDDAAACAAIMVHAARRGGADSLPELGAVLGIRLGSIGTTDSESGRPTAGARPMALG